MSPRAAWRLESLGFKHVYDYVAGKNDWTARALPIEGHLSHVPKAGDAMVEAPTCAPTDGAEQIRIKASGQGSIVVVNDQRIVFGKVTPQGLGQDGSSNIDSLMDVGPATVRPDEGLEALLERMRAHKVESAIVTDPDGRLMGLVERKTAAALIEAVEHSAHNS
jgi:CBS domain-containing protein